VEKEKEAPVILTNGSNLSNTLIIHKKKGLSRKKENTLLNNTITRERNLFGKKE